jgi:hypothetical protein
VRARLGEGLLAVLAVLAGALTGCAGAEPARDDLPAYCATSQVGGEVEFWRLIERSCRMSADGDVRQARALRRELRPLDAEQVADFHRTFVRLNHALYTKQMAAASDEVCLPGVGLGDDLFTDLRSWVVAHGQLAYEWVLEDPSRLSQFPDITSGCGLGEPFGDAGFAVYLEKTGRTARDSGLPSLEPTTLPMS